MTTFGESNILQAVGWAVFNSLWQMAILWVAYQLLLSVFKISKSSHRSLLSALLLFAGFAWFAVTLITGLLNNTGNNEGYTGLFTINSNGELNDWMRTMLPLASILYLLLLILPILNFIRNYRYVQVIRRYGLSRAGVEWRMFVQKISSQMGIRKHVHIWMSEMVSSPVTIGYIKPVILLPIAAINHLSTQQIEAVLLHELAHIKRYDYFVNLLTKFIQTILYFNPFVKAFAKIIEREREKDCDETVIQFQYEPHGYASALLALEKAAHIPRHSFAVAASDGKKSEFLQRIEWIVGIRKKPAFSYNKLAGVLAALLCFIALNALLIVGKPVLKKDGAYTFNLLASPLQFTGEDDHKATVTTEHKADPIVNHSLAAEARSTDISGTGTSDNEPSLASDASAYQFVYDLQNVIPKLEPAKEKQVQQVVAESRKVLQNIKWNEVEKSIADAMTSIEKENVKEQVKKAINSIDMKKVEDNLRIAYDNIDWKTVNNQLNTQLALIQFDSLQHVYTIALNTLSDMQKELVKEDEPGIPDTDVTVQSLETKIKAVKTTLTKIRTARPKKIINL